MNDSYRGSLDSVYNFICITNEKDMEDLCGQLKSCRSFAVDTETTGFDPVKCDCIGVSVCIQEGVSFYIPFGHSTGEQLSKAQVVKYFKPIFENEKIEKYLHNAVFDMEFLYAMGIDLKGLAFDSLVAARCVATRKRRNGLKYLSEEYFNETMIDFKEAVTDNGYKDFSEVPLELATKYAAADAHQTLKLTRVLSKELEEKDMQCFYYQKELPAVEEKYQIKKKRLASKMRESQLSPGSCSESEIQGSLFATTSHKRHRDEKLFSNKRRKIDNSIF